VKSAAYAAFSICCRYDTEVCAGQLYMSIWARAHPLKSRETSDITENSSKVAIRHDIFIFAIAEMHRGPFLPFLFLFLF
jgi:hypothetical protein